MAKLTVKQKKFADEYIKSGNATQSAIKAGYSKKTAGVIGTENLIKPNIKSYIDERLKKIESAKIMDAQEALQLLTSIARGEEKETVISSTPSGVYETEKEADIKTRIVAVKEILKRYPENDRALDAQTRKIEAEAEIAEQKARDVTGNADEKTQTLIVNDLEGKNSE